MNNRQTDLQVLDKLNDGYVRAYEAGDIAFFEAVLAEDFVSSEPDFRARNKQEFLEMLRAPRNISGMEAHEVQIRVFGDFALIHASLTYLDAKGVKRHGRYTDDYQFRDGKWVCIAGTVIADRT